MFIIKLNNVNLMDFLFVCCVKTIEIALSDLVNVCLQASQKYNFCEWFVVLINAKMSFKLLMTKFFQQIPSK